MLPGMNTKQMEKVMKRMGIKQEEIPANEVIIKTDDKEIIIRNPQVSKVNAMGQETFQIVGEVEERELKKEIPEDDIKTVADQANVNLEKAKEALEETGGDLAQAILNLKS